ncbi:MAG: hypothetical protein ACM3VZ_01680 [Acidobacteriota bacterium]
MSGLALLRASGLCVAVCALMGPAEAQVRSPAFALTLSPVAQSSGWDERDQKGRVLLHENGRLVGWRLSGLSGWRNWQLGLATQSLSGRRLYDGQTNGGLPVQTHVNVDLNEAQLTAHYLSESGWLLGLERGRRHQRRQLLSVPSVAKGYTERWTSEEWRWRAGVRWQGSGQWQASVAVTPWARTRMELDSPAADLTLLYPQKQKAAQLALAWRSPADGGWIWGWHSQLDWRRSARSDSVAWMRAGALWGALAQPETREVLYGVGMEIGRVW